MSTHKSVAVLVPVVFFALAGLAYGQSPNSGKPTTPTPTQVEVVNKTVLVGTTTLRVTSTDPKDSRTPPFDVSPYNTVRVVVTTTAECPATGSGRGWGRVENIAELDAFVVSATSVQRVYDMPGETLSVLIGNFAPGATCDWMVTIYGRRN